MNFVMLIVMYVLFVALVPNVLLHLPPRSSFMTSVYVHGLVFIGIWYFIHRPLMSMTAGMM